MPAVTLPPGWRVDPVGEARAVFTAPSRVDLPRIHRRLAAFGEPYGATVEIPPTVGSAPPSVRVTFPLDRGQTPSRGEVTFLADLTLLAREAGCKLREDPDPP